MVQQLFYVHFGEILLVAEESETKLSNCFVEVFKLPRELECSSLPSEAAQLWWGPSVAFSHSNSTSNA